MKLRFMAPLVLIMACSAACGDDDDDAAANNGGSSSSSKNLSAADVAAGACDMMQSGSDAMCEGVDEYSECIQNACEDAYETCLGAGYKSGNFSGGRCETYFECVVGSSDKCDNDCKLEGECLDCFSSMFTSCALNGNCALPDCTGGGSAGSGSNSGGAGTGINLMSDKTCDDLMACCDSLSGMNKDLCNQAYNGVKAAGDVACGAAFTTFMALGCE